MNESMEELPKCVKCHSEYTYKDRDLFICPNCGYEWAVEPELDSPEEGLVVKDAHGSVLHDGDSVTIIKDIKIKGSSSVIKVGVKVKNIRLVAEVNGHNIDAKVPGFGSMMLKSTIVKKSSE